jgi:hypothetical protein
MATLMTERRAKKRFQIDRPVHYRLLFGPGLGQVGSGRAVDLSSSGVCIETDAPLRVGDPLELLIDWPAPLDGVVQLQLATAGCVVRVDGRRAAVSIERYEFRVKKT